MVHVHSYNFMCLSTSFSFFTRLLTNWVPWRMRWMRKASYGEGRGEQKQVVFPTEREEIKCDIPLPTGCWFAMLSPSINVCLLDFFIIHLKWKNSSFNTGSSQYCFCTIAWLSNANNQKNFGMIAFFMLNTFKSMKKENYEGGGWISEVHSLNTRHLQSSCYIEISLSA